MDFLDALIDRNMEFSLDGFDPGLKIIPSARTMIIGCVDPRVDPMEILKLNPGEAAIIRNVGGRINPALFGTLNLLSTVSQAAGQPMGAGWHLIVLHHTLCGIVGCYHHAPALLADYMGVPLEELDSLAIVDPYAAVVIDVEALRSNPAVAGGFLVSGLVYDVESGRVEVVVPCAVLRPDAD